MNKNDDKLKIIDFKDEIFITLLKIGVIVFFIGMIYFVILLIFVMGKGG